MNEKLSQAIKAIKSGDKQTGYRHLVAVIDANPKSKDAENAWLWMSTVVDGTKRKKKCLETTLALNPNNDYARKKLAQLNRSSRLDYSSKIPQMPVYKVTPLELEDLFLGGLREHGITAKDLISILIERMDGIEFEHTVCVLLENQGFDARVTQASGDLGVDILAVKHEVKYAIQVKKQKDPVSRRAVSDAVAGREHYGCDIAMVITNSDFSKGAKELANSTRCKLVGRETLNQWFVEVQTYLIMENLKRPISILRKNIDDFTEYIRNVADYFTLLKSENKLIFAGFKTFLEFTKIHLDLLNDIRELFYRAQLDVNPEGKTALKDGILMIDDWVVQVQNQVANWKKMIGYPE